MNRTAKVLCYAGMLLLLVGVVLRIEAKTFATPMFGDHPRMDTYAQLVGTGWSFIGVGACLVLVGFANRARKHTSAR